MTLTVRPAIARPRARRPGARALAGALCAAVAFGMGSPVALATETDQFTLPPQPLDDLGRDMGAIVLDVVRAGVADINARIAERRWRDPRAGLEPADERLLATRVFEETGIGMPEATMERVLRYGDFGKRNVRFAPSYWDTIYAGAISPYPLAHITTNCPTIRLYGIYVGTDKPGHIFQTGYEYYTKYEDARAGGADEASALAAAIRYGVLTEKGLYGIMLTGVYSNADLAANYAGLMFFRNLFHEVRIGTATLPPIVRRDGDRYVVDPARDDADLLRPFVSEHLSEAYNPPRHLFSLERIRGHVRARCASWAKQVPDFGEASYRARLERNRTWFGQPYGWDLPEADAATLLECFREAG
jgi:hypothetical protein